MSVALLYRFNGGDPEVYDSDEDDPQVAHQNLIMETLCARPREEEWTLTIETLGAEPRRWSHTHLGEP